MVKPKYDALFLIGRPGGGKGTQAKLLKQRYGYAIVSTGALFRKLAQKPTKVGKNVKRTLAQGKLMPSWLAMKVVLDALEKFPASRPVIFDGSPRTAQEAEWLLEALSWFGRNRVCAVHLHIAPVSSFERLFARNRHDDTRIAIRERLNEFEHKVALALRLLKRKKLLKEINGNQPILKVAQDIRKALL